MKNTHPVLVTNIIIFVAFALFMGLFGWAGVGAVAVIQGGVNMAGTLIELLLGQRNRAKYFLLCGGVLLLIGFTLCSTFRVEL